MSEPRIINKYPNRRLYDTEISRYITLEEIRQLVLTGVDFTIIDKRTKEDITRSILLQVIAEQEEGGDPIFTTEVLTHIIRFYGDSMQSAMSNYLEMSLKLFNEQQQQFRDQMRTLVGNNPIQMLRDLSQNNMPLWRSVRREFIKNLANGNEGSEDNARKPPSSRRRQPVKASRRSRGDKRGKS